MVTPPAPNVFPPRGTGVYDEIVDAQRQLTSDLDAAGFPVVGFVAADRWRELSAAAPPWTPLFPWARTLALALHAGDSVWRRVRDRSAAAAAHAFDEYTADVLAAAAARLREAGSRGESRTAADPGVATWPLGRLCVAAGLGWIGRHGLLLHPRYGGWIAVRGILAIEAAWPAPGPRAETSPCDGCPAPCAAACPGQAIGENGYDVRRCSDTRMQVAACSLDCAARRACPVGGEFQYSSEQMAYHMAQSLRTLRTIRAPRG